MIQVGQSTHAKEELGKDKSVCQTEPRRGLQLPVFENPVLQCGIGLAGLPKSVSHLVSYVQVTADSHPEMFVSRDKRKPDIAASINFNIHAWPNSQAGSLLASSRGTLVFFHDFVCVCFLFFWCFLCVFCCICFLVFVVSLACVFVLHFMYVVFLW